MFKLLTNLGLRRIGKYNRWKSSEMHDVSRDHRTVLECPERMLDKGLGDEYFEVAYLERGR